MKEIKNDLVIFGRRMLAAPTATRWNVSGWKKIYV
jgi:hypothetical protein